MITPAWHGRTQHVWWSEYLSGNSQTLSSTLEVCNQLMKMVLHGVILQLRCSYTFHVCRSGYWWEHWQQCHRLLGQAGAAVCWDGHTVGSCVWKSWWDRRWMIDSLFCMVRFSYWVSVHENGTPFDSQCVSLIVHNWPLHTLNRWFEWQQWHTGGSTQVRYQLLSL